jgi:hypothetical protein
MRVTNSIPLECSLLPVHTVNSVQTLKKAALTLAATLTLALTMNSVQTLKVLDWFTGSHP